MKIIKTFNILILLLILNPILIFSQKKQEIKIHCKASQKVYLLKKYKELLVPIKLISRQKVNVRIESGMPEGSLKKYLTIKPKYDFYFKKHYKLKYKKYLYFDNSRFNGYAKIKLDTYQKTYFAIIPPVLHERGMYKIRVTISYLKEQSMKIKKMKPTLVYLKVV